MSIYPDAPFVPGGSYTIQITGNLPVGLPILSPACTNAYLSAIITGVADYGPPSPYVTVSGLTNTSPTLSFFTATVSGDAPVGNGVAFVLDTGSFLDSYVFIFQPAPGSNPPPNPATCTTPAITSVSPGTWVAGKSYDITIMGSCFNDISGIYIQTDAGTAVKVSKIKVVSPAEITATVKPAINEPNEAAYLLVRNNYEQSAMATVAIVSCPTPAIAEIKPSTWFAGRTYNKVVITGSNFTTKKDQAKTSCPVTPVSITAADGSTVPVSNVTVDSATQITVTGVAPPASDPTETATVTVGTAPSTSKPPTPAQILGNQIQCDPSMNCTQPVISTTDGSPPPAQGVVVGQQIALATNPDLPATITPTSKTWTAGGTKIAGYNPSTGKTDVTPLKAADLKKANITFFWVYPNSASPAAIPVTYTYCVNITGLSAADVANKLNCSLPANASFNLGGPGDAQMAVDAYDLLNVDWLIHKNGCLPILDDEDPYMDYGNISSYEKPCKGGLIGDPPGIIFTLPTAASDGNYSFVQLIAKDTTTYTQGGHGSLQCPTRPGLDGDFPYPLFDPDNNRTWDAPGVGLEQFDSRVSRTFKATMYLLWKSSKTGSIYVPIGSQSWIIDRGSTTNSGYPTDQSWTDPVWSALGKNGDPVDYVKTAPNQSPYGYPTWKGPAAFATIPSCPTDNTQEDEEQ
jgi:hypothetical protein